MIIELYPSDNITPDLGEFQGRADLPQFIMYSIYLPLLRNQAKQIVPAFVFQESNIGGLMVANGHQRNRI